MEKISWHHITLPLQRAMNTRINNLTKETLGSHYKIWSRGLTWQEMCLRNKSVRVGEIDWRGQQEIIKGSAQYPEMGE